MILVVGATGQLGTAIIRKLVATKQPVRAFVRRTSAYQHLQALGVELALASESAGKAFFMVYLDTSLHVPTASIGAIVAVGQLLAIPAALFTPILLSRWGRPRKIQVSLLGITICLLPLALIPCGAPPPSHISR